MLFICPLKKDDSIESYRQVWRIGPLAVGVSMKYNL